MSIPKNVIEFFAASQTVAEAQARQTAVEKAIEEAKEETTLGAVQILGVNFECIANALSGETGESAEQFSETQQYILRQVQTYNRIVTRHILDKQSEQRRMTQLSMFTRHQNVMLAFNNQSEQTLAVDVFNELESVQLVEGSPECAILTWDGNDIVSGESVTSC